ncbi:MAG TPA: WG repeat-containing protein, partial [Flavobacterium sp.]|nr:WG repeat-containing protein [Flavobacterium sp.]
KLVPYEENGKFGYKDSIGNVIVQPKYDKVKEFYHGAAPVNIGGSYHVTEWGYTSFKGGKWGIIDQTEKEIAPIKYDYIGTFHEGRALVAIKEKHGYIDTTGKEVVPVIYILEAKDIKDINHNTDRKGKD